MMVVQPRNTGHLRIRVRRTLSSEDGVSLDPLVFCPHRERSLAIDECAECDDYRGLSVDPRQGHSTLRCVWDVQPADATEPSPALGRLPWVKGPVADPPASASETPVAVAMSGDVICVRSDLGVEAAIRLLLEHRIGGAPVVDREGNPIGILSKTDLLERGSARTVGGIMGQRPIITLPEDASIAQAAAVMAYEGVHRIPIVSHSNQVVGILTTSDVARWLARTHGYVLPDQAQKPSD
jgi:CBS domain-containing protein